jgi:hypothetical protein
MISNAIRFHHDFVALDGMVTLNSVRGECGNRGWGFVRAIDRVRAVLNGKSSSTV